MKSVGVLIMAIAAVVAVPIRAAEQVMLDAPEGACWDAGSRSWFVSNLGGGLSLARDGYGWISRFDESGRLVASRWVEFLDAPTGMAVVGRRLYVIDRAGVVEIDIDTAKVLTTIALPDGKFANDVAAAPNGDLYVSDTELNRIYRLGERRVAEVWLASERLENPNGLWVDGEDLIVATWGPMTDIATFATRHPGTILRVRLADKQITPLGDGKPIANLDGIVKLGPSYFATDWRGGRLLRISPAGHVQTVLSGFWQLADLGVDPEGGVLALPVMSEDRLILVNTTALR